MKYKLAIYPLTFLDVQRVREQCGKQWALFNMFRWKAAKNSLIKSFCVIVILGKTSYYFVPFLKNNWFIYFHYCLINLQVSFGVCFGFLIAWLPYACISLWSTYGDVSAIPLWITP